MTSRTLVSTISIIGISCILANAFAGGPDRFSSTNISPKGGFYIGLGGEYNSGKVTNKATFTNISTDIDDPIKNPDFVALSTDWDSHQNSLAPNAQIGFLKLESKWAWGVKATYAYLKQRSDSGVLNSIFRTEATHLFSIFFSVGKNLTENGHNFIFLGVGPSVAQLKTRVKLLKSSLEGRFSEIPDINELKSKFTWGASGQIELIHYFNSTLFLSTSYTYTWLSPRLFSNSIRYKTDGNTLTTVTLNRNIYYSNQAISLSINKVFAL